MRQPSKHDLRCFCKGEPLLAKYGVDERGKLYVHIRVFKSREVYGEILVTDGTVKILCRYCHRWHTVTIRRPGVAALVESDPPAEVVAKSS